MEFTLVTHPIGGVIEHLLPRGVELHPLLHEPLLRQSHHLLGRLVGRGGLLEPEIRNKN